jgi:hypothetical protein
MNSMMYYSKKIIGVLAIVMSSVTLWAQSNMSLKTEYDAGGPTSTSGLNIESVTLYGANDTYFEWEVNCDSTQSGTENLINQYFCEVARGLEYTIVVKFGTCNSDGEGLGALWADWNNDYIYETNDENIGYSSGSTNRINWKEAKEFTFKVPDDAALGTTGLRIMLFENCDYDPTPYETYNSGSMTDFGLTIIEAPTGYNAGGGGPLKNTDSNVESVNLLGANNTIIDWNVDCNNTVKHGLNLSDSIYCELKRGEQYTLEVKFGTCGAQYPGAGSVWIDWNNDFIYDTLTEFVGVSYGTPGLDAWNEPVAFTFTVPYYAALDTMGIRIIQQEGQTQLDDLDPYAEFNWGSMTDFGLIVLNGTSSYLSAGPTKSDNSNIELLTLVGVNNTSIEWSVDCGNTVSGVENLIYDYSVDLQQGAEYTLGLKFGTCGDSYSGGGAFWIDWNNDGIFDATTELMGSSYGTPGIAPWDDTVKFTFTVPNDAIIGNTSMRVMQHQTLDTAPDPYTVFEYGSMADYSINVCKSASGYTSGGPTLTTKSNIAYFIMDGENGTAIDWKVDCDKTVVGTENLIQDYNCELIRGKSYTASVFFGSCTSVNYEMGGALWIDWNNDLFYDVLTETIDTLSGQVGYDNWEGYYDFTFTVPEDAVLGLTGMRIMQHALIDSDFDPYATYKYGSMTDFGLIINQYEPTAFSADSSYMEQTLLPDHIAKQKLTLFNGTADSVSVSLSIDYILEDAEPASVLPSSEEVLMLYQDRKMSERALNDEDQEMLTAAKSTKYQGEILEEISIESICNDDYQLLGIEFDGINLWIAGGGSDSDPNYLYKINYETKKLVQAYEQPETSDGFGIYDLAMANGKIYGGDDTYFYCFDPATEEWTKLFTSTIGKIYALAYDGTYFWTKYNDQPLYCFDGKTGEVILETTPTVATEATGAAYDFNEGFLYIYNNNNTYYQFDLKGMATGETVDVSGAALGDGESGGAFFEYGTLFEGTATLTSLVQSYIDVVAVAELYTFDQYNDDVAVIDIVAPESNMLLSNEEVIVTVKNFGIRSQYNIPIEIKINGELFYSGIIPETLDTWETTTINCGIVDMSKEGGEWNFEAYTNLANDENNSNDTITRTVINQYPGYCVPSGLTCNYGDYISSFTLGTISNVGSGCSDNAYGDFTDMSTEILQGTDMDLSIKCNVNKTVVNIYIDLNGDWDFDDAGELVLNGFNCVQSGQLYTTPINVNGASVHSTRMRVITNWVDAPLNSCGGWEYGEVEDYTVTFDDVSLGWLSVSPNELILPMDNTQEIDVQFNSNDLGIGVYKANLTIEGAESPIVLPITCNVEINEPYLSLSTVNLKSALNCDTISTIKTLTISNPSQFDMSFTYRIDADGAWLLTPNNNEGDSISLLAGESYAMDIEFNASNMLTGNYSGNITFSSNSAYRSAELACNLEYTCAPICNPVRNLQAVQSEYDAYLTWTAPDTTKVEGINAVLSTNVLVYAIYRDDVKVGATSKTFFTDIEPVKGTYTYAVEAVFDTECVSDQETVSLSIEDESSFVAPYDFALSEEIWNDETGTLDAVFNWSHPACNATVGKWLYYDDQYNNLGIGGVASFYWAIHWDAEFMEEYGNQTITKIAIHPYAVGRTADAAFTLMIWEGAGAESLIMEQEVRSYKPGEWNTIILDFPVTIDGSKDLYVGAYSEDGLNYPAGCDVGPAIAGYSDLLSVDGLTWQSASVDYGMDYNWNIEMWVESTVQGTHTILGKTKELNNSEVSIEARGTKSTGNKFAQEGLVTFDLYDTEGNYLSSTTACSDTLSNAIYNSCYYVLAKYSDGQSGPSNEDCTTSANELEVSDLKIFPNPATNSLMIESDVQIEQVQVYNMVGQLVAQYKVGDTGIVELNTTSYESGIYLLHITINSRTTIERVSIIK